MSGAGEFEGGEDLSAVVVEGGGGVGDLEAHQKNSSWAGSWPIRYFSTERKAKAQRIRRAAAFAFTEANEAGVGLDLDDGSDEVGHWKWQALKTVTQGASQGDGYSCGFDGGDFHKSGRRFCTQMKTDGHR